MYLSKLVIINWAMGALAQKRVREEISKTNFSANVALYILLTKLKVDL